MRKHIHCKRCGKEIFIPETRICEKCGYEQVVTGNPLRHYMVDAMICDCCLLEELYARRNKKK